MLAGDRFGVCLPVLCEYHGGIRLGSRYARNLARLRAALKRLRIWPADELTALEFADIYLELRADGAMLAQFDLLIASIARQRQLTLLTADRDFDPVKGLQIENWL